MNEFITYFKNSSLEEQEILIRILLEIIQHNLNKDLINKTPKDKKQINCYHDKSNTIQENGKNKGVQRYRCKDCRKNFYETTGTPLAWFKKEDKWSDYFNACSRAIGYVNVLRKSTFAYRFPSIGVIKY